MKISEVAARINNMLSQELSNFGSDHFISPTKINGYIKMNIVTPSLKKAPGKSYFEFEEIHVDLILKAYRKIVFQKMRTRDAFLKASEEIRSPSFI